MFSKPTDEQLASRYSFHPASEEQAARYGAIRSQCLALAKYIRDVTPCCPDQSLAFTALDEVMFRANAAIARNEAPEPLPGPRELPASHPVAAAVRAGYGKKEE